MSPSCLTTVAEEQLRLARAAPHGRHAHTVYGGSGHALRQTVLAIVAGQFLAEHDSPGDATLQVLRGQVRLAVGDESTTGGQGDLLVVPPARHSLHADQDSVVLLTVAVR